MKRGAQLNFLMLIVSVVLGFLAWLVCLIVYNAIVDLWPRPLVIGVMFSLLSLILLLGIHLLSTLQGTFEGNIMTGGSGGTVVPVLLAAVLAMGALGVLFQWIYGLHFDRQTKEPSAYVFVIDDSGSMSSNDPNQLRYQAIDQVLENQSGEFPYMVYSFSDGATLLRGMGPQNAGFAVTGGVSSGGTYMKAALEQVIADYENGVWQGGDTPKVILLTDGYASDKGLFDSSFHPVLKQFSKNHISISTVGLGDVDKSLMERIAAKTGGVFVDISDAALLGTAMESAASQYSVDDLLTTRYPGRLDVLFGFLRVLFLTLLGALLGLACAVAYGQMDSSSLVVMSSAVLSLVGALVMELLTGLGVADRLCWLLLWLLLAATVCLEQTRSRRGPARPAQRSARPSMPSRRSGRSSHILR